MKILYVADFPNWCFDKMGKQLQKWGKHEYTIRYKGKDKYKSAFKNCNDFDLIVYAVDVRPDHILRYNPPKEKTVVLIRSDVFKLCKKGRDKFYRNAEKVKDHVSAFMCANVYLKDKLENIHSIPTFYAPGGVDTKLFHRTRRKPSTHSGPRVGWSGSLKYYGQGIRGVNLVEQACNNLGWEWNPAIKEETWRTPEEMVEYYNDEIDLYVDASSTAGRQNGLLEASACGLTCLCTKVGIGWELIDAGSAIEIVRDVENIQIMLVKALESCPKPQYIKREWSWETHTKRWESIFEEVKRGR